MASKTLKDFMKKLSAMDGAVNDRKNIHERVIDSGSPSLNFCFGKGHGLPFGHSMLLFGEPKAGKTLICNSMVGRLHQIDPEAIAIKFNTEYREHGQLTEESARAWGIDLDRYKAYETNLPTEIFDRIEQDFSSMADEGLKIGLIIIDSINGVQGRRALNADSISVQQIGDNAMTIQEGLKRILPVQRKHNFALVLTSQIRAQMDVAAQMRGEKTKAAVSFATKHHCEYFMSVDKINGKTGQQDILGHDLKDEDLTDLQENADKTGHRVRVKMTDSSLGPKGRAGEFTIDYNRGIVNTHEEVFLLGVNRNIIQHPNNVMYAFGGKEWRGKEAMLDAIRADQMLYDDIMKELRLQDLAPYKAKLPES